MMLRHLIGALLIGFLLYGGIEAWPLIVGPRLTITSPLGNASYPDGIVPVEGSAARAAVLTVNGAVVLHDQKGGFSSTFTFPHGSSILTFVATDRFGRTVSATRTIFVP